MNTSTDQRRKALELKKQEIQKRIDQTQRNERSETAHGQTDTAHEWENADVRDRMLSVAMEELRQVDAALRRIEVGTYGLCSMCGEPIAEKRLEAVPFATLCIGCAESQQ